MSHSDYRYSQDFQDYDERSHDLDDLPLWNETRSTYAAPSSTSSPSAQSQGVMAALQSRSGEGAASFDRQPVSVRHTQSESPTVTNFVESAKFNHFLRELQYEAQQINQLSAQQLAAIERFKRKVERLPSMLRVHGEPAVHATEFCQLRNAAVPWVIETETGKLTLTTRKIDLLSDIQDASATATFVREFGKSHASHSQHGDVKKTSRFINTFWQRLRFTIDEKSQLTPLDIFMWFGGGLFGRIGLQFVLALQPGWWPWVIAASIAAVAFALYKFLFTSQQDVSLIARLFLALVGLAVGGQFQFL